jgi:hypothetical protein
MRRSCLCRVRGILLAASAVFVVCRLYTLHPPITTVPLKPGLYLDKIASGKAKFGVRLSVTSVMGRDVPGVVVVEKDSSPPLAESVSDRSREEGSTASPSFPRPPTETEWSVDYDAEAAVPAPEISYLKSALAPGQVWGDNDNTRSLGKHARVEYLDDDDYDENHSSAPEELADDLAAEVWPREREKASVNWDEWAEEEARIGDSSLESRPLNQPLNDTGSASREGLCVGGTMLVVSNYDLTIHEDYGCR